MQIDLERFGEAMSEETPPVIIGARRRDRKDTRFDLDPGRDGEGVALGTGQLWKLFISTDWRQAILIAEEDDRAGRAAPIASSVVNRVVESVRSDG